jgi:hypothetical protein
MFFLSGYPAPVGHLPTFIPHVYDARFTMSLFPDIRRALIYGSIIDTQELPRPVASAKYDIEIAPAISPRHSKESAFSHLRLDLVSRTWPVFQSVRQDDAPAEFVTAAKARKKA